MSDSVMSVCHAPPILETVFIFNIKFRFSQTNNSSSSHLIPCYISDSPCRSRSICVGSPALLTELTLCHLSKIKIDYRDRMVDCGVVGFEAR